MAGAWKVGLAEELGVKVEEDGNWKVRQKSDIVGFIRRYDEDLAAIIDEKIEGNTVRIKGNANLVVVDTKDVMGDYVVAVRAGKMKKSGTRKVKKEENGEEAATKARREKRTVRRGVSDTILEELKKYHEQKGEFTIGEFHKYLTEVKGMKVYRQQVYQVITKSGKVKFEYRTRGKAGKMIVITGVSL